MHMFVWAGEYMCKILQKSRNTLKSTLYILFCTLQKLFPGERVPNHAFIQDSSMMFKITFADYNTNKWKMPKNVYKNNFIHKPNQSERTFMC